MLDKTELQKLIEAPIGRNVTPPIRSRQITACLIGSGLLRNMIRNFSKFTLR